MVSTLGEFCQKPYNFSSSVEEDAVVMEERLVKKIDPRKRLLTIAQKKKCFSKFENNLKSPIE